MDTFLISFYKKYHDFKWFWIAMALMYPVIGLIAVMTYVSFNDASLPIAGINYEVQTAHSNSHYNIRLVKFIETKRNFEGIVFNRIIHNKTGLEYDLYIQYESFDKNNIMSKTFSVPSDLPDGSYVIRSNILWKPTFSLVNKLSYFPDVHLTLCKNEGCVS